MNEWTHFIEDFTQKMSEILKMCWVFLHFVLHLAPGKLLNPIKNNKKFKFNHHVTKNSLNNFTCFMNFFLSASVSENKCFI